MVWSFHACWCLLKTLLLFYLIWALALYVAHHDGKAKVWPLPVCAYAASVGHTCFCSVWRDDCWGRLLWQQGSTHVLFTWTKPDGQIRQNVTGRTEKKSIFLLVCTSACCLCCDSSSCSMAWWAVKSVTFVTPPPLIQSTTCLAERVGETEDNWLVLSNVSARLLFLHLSLLLLFLFLFLYCLMFTCFLPVKKLSAYIFCPVFSTFCPPFLKKTNTFYTSKLYSSEAFIFK